MVADVRTVQRAGLDATIQLVARGDASRAAALRLRLDPESAPLSRRAAASRFGVPPSTLRYVELRIVSIDDGLNARFGVGLLTPEARRRLRPGL